ncbi:MAG: T9SS type A sorting domain-containing protein [Hymenobacter sp.]|nr:T9SS type A sorting domain-containing protein [Hymenobacter sp.]
MLFLSTATTAAGLYQTPKRVLLTLGWSLLLLSFQPGRAQTPEPYSWNSMAVGGGGFVSGIVMSPTQAGLMYARTDVGGAYRWDQATSRWLPLMDWASEQQQGMFGVESLALDPQNAATVYAFCGISYFNNGRSFILRSTNYGATFTVTDVSAQFKAHGNGMGRANGEKLQVDPNNSAVLYCGTRYNGLFRSTNSGASWSRLPALNVTTTPNDNGVSFVLPDKTQVTNGETQRLFVGISRAGSSQNFYRSEDAGASFTAVVNPGLGADMLPQRAVLAGNGTLFISYGNGAGPHGNTYGSVAEPYSLGQIWKYAIATNTWTNVTPAGINKAFGGLSIDPANPNRLLISTTNNYQQQQGGAYGDRFYLSTNGGGSWTDVVSRGFTMDPNGVTWVPGQSIHWAGCIEFDPFDSRKVWVTSGNGVYSNDNIDNSGTWKFNVKGLEETVPLNLVSIPGGPLLSVIFDYDGFRHSDGTQYAPIHTPRMGSTTGLDYAARNTSKVVRAGSDLYYSNDQGLTWTKTATNNGAKGQVALSADGSVLLHSPEGSSTTYRSTNNGTNWTSVAGLGISSARPVADAVNANTFYAYNDANGEVLRSTNGGSSFALAGNAGGGGSKVIRAVPGREGHLWAALYGGGLTRSTNSGTSFSRIPGVTYCGAIGFGKAAPGATYETLYMWGTVGGTLGVYRSVTEGASWVRINDDAHEYGGPANGQFVMGDLNVYGRVYMSTAGRGIAYGNPLTPLPVTLAGFTAARHPEGVRLYWTTATERNNARFEVQRSATGLGGGFTTVTTTAGRGQSNRAQQYSAFDPQPLPGLGYYRLRQVDFDGTAALSPVVTVAAGKELALYPNPARTELHLVAPTVNARYRVLNGLGRVVLEGAAPTGTATLNLTRLSAGLYQLEVTSAAGRLVRKFVREN